MKRSTQKAAMFNILAVQEIKYVVRLIEVCSSFLVPKASKKWVAADKGRVIQPIIRSVTARFTIQNIYGVLSFLYGSLHTAIHTKKLPRIANTDSNTDATAVKYDNSIGAQTPLQGVDTIFVYTVISPKMKITQVGVGY